ncbi:MAG: arginase family protein, partial [Mesorhizobium sp.]
MKLSIILAPYDSGLYHAGCGQGPDAIIAGGLVDELTFRGHDVVVE